MPVTNTPIYPQVINTPVAQILPATTTGYVTLYTGGTNGSKVENIICTNTDSGHIYTIQFTIKISSIDYIIGTIPIPESAGNTTAVPAVDVLATLSATSPGLFNRDSNGNFYLYVASGAILQANCTTTVTTAMAVSFFTQGGDY